MKRIELWGTILAVGTLVGVLGVGNVTSAESVTATIQTEKIVKTIDEKVYGHFLEHIYNSCNGGLWGELVWNRSFEASTGEFSGWQWKENTLRQDSLVENQRFLFIPEGAEEATWTDYEMTLKAKKFGGSEGFLLLVRADREWSNYVWANLGGWGNKQNGFELGQRNIRTALGERLTCEPFEADRVYDLRVRVEGDRYQCFCDGKLILDVTNANGPKTGFAGVGTWQTSAEFSDILVKTLDGKVLYSGESVAPPAVKTFDIDRFWTVTVAKETISTDAVAIQNGDARNSDRYLKVMTPVVLSQKNFRLVEGETYDISFWRRGAGSVRLGFLLDGQETESVVAGGRSDEWTKVTGTIKLKTTTDDGKLILTITPENGQTLDIDQVSVCPQSWKANGGFRSDLLQAIAELHPPVIRWPGGCYASAYRWKSGIGPQDDRVSYPISIWNDVDANSFGTDEFVAMCRSVGAEPILVVNIGTKEWTKKVGDKGKDVDWLGEICQWVEYCNGSADSEWGKVRAANGHPEPYNIRYWEIDNEVDPNEREDYIKTIRELIPRMKAIDPKIEILACGSWTDDKMNWDNEVINGTAQIVDFISTHRYDDPNGFAVNPWDNQRFFEDHRRVIAESKNPNLKIFNSEWNAQSTDWRTGLHAGGILNCYERVSDVLAIAAPALFLRHTSADGWDNAFINFDQTGWFPAPNYVVMKLWRDHYQPYLLEVETKAADLTGKNPAINLVATRSADGLRVIVKAVNTLPEARKIEMTLAGNDATVASATGNVVTPTLADGEKADAKLDKRNTLAEKNAIHPEPLTIQTAGPKFSFTLPSFSAAVVEVLVD